MFRNYILLCLGFFMSVRAELLSPEERHGLLFEIRPQTEKCLKEFDLTFDEMIQKKKDGKLNKCFVACALKGSKVINEKGMFDPEEAMKLIAKFAKNEEKAKKFKEFGEICVAVNDKEVTDGDKGCERAGLLLDCFKEVITSTT